MAKLRKRGATWQIDYTDPAGKRIRMAFKKKKDAEAELGKRVSLIAEKRYLDVRKDYKTTLGALLTKYKENYRDQRSFNTWKAACLKNCRGAFGEDTILANVRYVDLETYKNQLKAKLTPAGKIRTVAAVNREIAVLHHMFRKAVEWDLMERSPFDGKQTLLVKENNKRFRFLPEEDIRALLRECPKHVRRVVVCALNTGMRRGEILGLKWDQVREGFIYLEGAMVKTKTDEARQIPINNALEALFQDIRAEQPLGTEHVFTYRNGQTNMKGPEPVRQRLRALPEATATKDIKTAFKAAVRRAGIRDFRFHDLRHTFASQMVMRGASLKDVQEILGHKTMTMTLRYAHLSQDHKKKAVNLLDGLTTDQGVYVTKCHKMPLGEQKEVSLAS